MKKQTSQPTGGMKLSLNKKTISNLTAAGMSKHVGGASTAESCGHCPPGKTEKGNTCYYHKTCS
jgi:hypothetical protein